MRLVVLRCGSRAGSPADRRSFYRLVDAADERRSLAVSTNLRLRRNLPKTRPRLCGSPRRGSVLAAKAIVAGTLAFTAAAIATAIAELITRRVLAANGNYLFPQSGPELARVIIGTGLLLGLAAALTVALGTILRRSAATVAAGIALLVLQAFSALNPGTG